MQLSQTHLEPFPLCLLDKPPKPALNFFFCLLLSAFVKRQGYGEADLALGSGSGGAERCGVISGFCESFCLPWGFPGVMQYSQESSAARAGDQCCSAALDIDIN